MCIGGCWVVIPDWKVGFQVQKWWANLHTKVMWVMCSHVGWGCGSRSGNLFCNWKSDGMLMHMSVVCDQVYRCVFGCGSCLTSWFPIGKVIVKSCLQQVFVGLLFLVDKLISNWDSDGKFLHTKVSWFMCSHVGLVCGPGLSIGFCNWKSYGMLMHMNVVACHVYMWFMAVIPDWKVDFQL